LQSLRDFSPDIRQMVAAQIANLRHPYGYIKPEPPPRGVSRSRCAAECNRRSFPNSRRLLPSPSEPAGFRAHAVDALATTYVADLARGMGA
jgi:hypothetical protein